MSRIEDGSSHDLRAHDDVLWFKRDGGRIDDDTLAGCEGGLAKPPSDG